MVKRLALSAWHVIGFILLMLSLTVTVGLFCVRYIVLDESVYHAIPESPGFVEGMTKYVLTDLENECDIYANSDALYEHLRTTVTTDWVKSLSEQYARSVYQSLMTGAPLEEIEVDAAIYRRSIESFFETLPAEERPEELAVTAQTMAEELADSTANVLQSGLFDKVIPPAHQYVYGNATVRRLSSLFGWSVVATAVLTVLNLLWFGSDIRRRLYAVCGALFLGSALAFIPLYLVQNHGIAQRLVLGNSPLKLYVSGAVNGLVDAMTSAAMWVFIGCAVLLVASVVDLVWPSRKCKGEQKSMKILCIGNSFSTDATRYLEAMAEGELMVRNCYIGGCSLQRHCANIEADAAEYEYQKDAVAVSDELVALSDALTREAWDWITVQQVSSQSGKPESYEPYMTQLLEYVRKLCPQAKIAFHRTWAYETGSEHPGFVHYGNDRERMFTEIMVAGEQVAAAHELPVIPSGDAVQRAGRMAEFDAAQGGQSLYRDGFHMHLVYGRYLVGLCWYRFFTGKSASTVTYVPEDADTDKLDKLKEIAG